MEGISMKPQEINPQETTLTISFQFHHTQMDGAHAGLLLKLLQRNINEIERKYLIKR